MYIYIYSHTNIHTYIHMHMHMHIHIHIYIYTCTYMTRSTPCMPTATWESELQKLILRCWDALRGQNPELNVAFWTMPTP